jgi:uncharacterized protein (TIGR02246 family)
MNKQTLTQFAERYTAAWCSQNAANVAGFFAPDGSLTINRGTPSAGREAITAAAQSWTLTGTNTGTGATGKSVRISGYERWCLTHDGLIAESQGHFDQAAYEKQLESLRPVIER